MRFYLRQQSGKRRLGDLGWHLPGRQRPNLIWTEQAQQLLPTGDLNQRTSLLQPMIILLDPRSSKRRNVTLPKTTTRGRNFERSCRHPRAAVSQRLPVSQQTRETLYHSTHIINTRHGQDLAHAAEKSPNFVTCHLEQLKHRCFTSPQPALWRRLRRMPHDHLIGALG